jgi:hypothetical protein
LIKFVRALDVSYIIYYSIFKVNGYKEAGIMQKLLKFLPILLFSAVLCAAQKVRVMDDFESLGSWFKFTSDKTVLDIASIPGAKGSAVNLKFDFTPAQGYVVIVKDIAFQLPDNYAFKFYIKGNSKPNNLEFKLKDKDNNYFWKKLPDYVFPSKWTEITIKKSDISFAWGPNNGAVPKDITRIELGVSCGQGGKGEVAFDELQLIEIEDTSVKFNPTATASTFEKDEFAPGKAVDNAMSTRWSSVFADQQWLTLDIGREDEVTGLSIYWEAAFAKEYNVLLSRDGVKWTKVFSTAEGAGESEDIVFPKQKARYIKLDLVKRGTGYGFSIFEIKVKGRDKEILPSASSDDGINKANSALDSNKSTFWRSGSAESQWLALDFQKSSEFGGLFIYWGPDYASEYDVLGSKDGDKWYTLYSVKEGNGERDRIFLKNPEYRYVRLAMKKSSRGKGYAVTEIEVKGPENAASPQKSYEVASEEKPAGWYPKYLSGKQTYWTLVGVNSDQKEALLNEEGMFEVDAERFSVEPFLYADNKFYNWGNVKISQALEKEYLPIPSVTWKADKLTMTEKVFADGEPGRSTIVAWYRITNTSAANSAGKVFLAVRPFQVDPPWQCLFSKGGLAKISRISYDGDLVSVDGDKNVIPLTKPDNFGAAAQASGDITKFLSKGTLPEAKSVTDADNYASGALEYSYSLAPGESKDIYIAVPFYAVQPGYRANMAPSEASMFVTDKFNANARYWDSKIGGWDIKVPGADKQWIDTMKTYIGYILINKDGPATKPGSRSYNRSWIRDGSMTCSSLLKMGMKQEVRDYADWYSKFLFDYGRVPCNIIGDNQAESFNENDSNGEYIYLFSQYYNYTRDAAFINQHASDIIKAADYIITQRNERKTAKYTGTYFYGLVPESASHEGYCDKFMHSYWDDFFALKGLKDASKLMALAGRNDLKEKYEREALDFRACIMNSIKQTMKEHNISYIPGCAEKGDFDATSTSIGIYPCDEYNYMPKDALKATFDRYYADMEKRFVPGAKWGENYTPYEVRNIRSFIFMDQKDRAHRITDYFFSDMRPPKWNFWPEVVWRDRDNPKFIGDMPHTWVGADYISSMRSLFVIEDENTDSIVFCKGVRDSWLDDKDGVQVINLPTIWGVVNYDLKKKGDAVTFSVTGNISVPGQIILASPLSKPVKSVTVNGSNWNNFTAKEIKLKKIPSQVVINY